MNQSSASPLPVGPLLERVLTLAYQARKPVLIEGPSGIGKSESVQAVARGLAIACTALDLSLLEPPDLIGLPVIAKGVTRYASPAILPREGAGILLLEELNRAERYIRQPVLQLLSARRLNDYVLPESWSLVAAVNPSGADYDVEALDEALLDRFLRLRVRADRDSWLKWAERQALHDGVLGLARMHDRLLEDVSPRTWKHVSDLLKRFGSDADVDEPTLEAVLGGYLPEAWVTALLAIRTQWDDDAELALPALLAGYADSTALQAQVQSLRARGRTDVFERLSHRLFGLLEESDLSELARQQAFSLSSFERLLEDLPGDYAERAQRAFAMNPSALALLDLEPERVVFGGDARVTERIDAWLESARLWHRARALASGLAHYLETRADLAAVRDDTRAHRRLGHLLSQLKYPYDRHLARALDRLRIPAIVPRRLR